MAFLQVLDGERYGKRYPLSAAACTIGREHHCGIFDLFDDNVAVSRQHACIAFSDGQFIVEDLSSRNGTRLNGRLLEAPAPLRDGDLLSICNYQLVFREGDASRKDEMPKPNLSFFVDQSDDEVIHSSLSVSSSISRSLQVTAQTRFEALLTLLSQMGQSLELGVMLDHLLEAILKVFPQADRGFVGLQSPDGTVVPAATRPRDAADKRPVVISRRIVERVVALREAILLSDTLSDLPDESTNSLSEAQIRSIMCAPLLDSDENVVGLLQVDSLRANRQFQPEDLERLVALAPQATFAVRVGQLHRQSLKQLALERDLQLAAHVQASLLPRSPPAIEGYEFFTHYQTARHVGGDYYDFVPLADGRIAVVVADVSGKGVAAALVMAELRGQFSYLLRHEASPAEALKQINENLVHRSQEAKFVTLVLAILDFATHEVALFNAGHMAPLRRSTAGKVSPLGAAQRGMALGINVDETYEEYRFALQRGESLTLYTDGVTDAQNPSQQWYGDDRLTQSLERADGNAEAIGRAILKDVDAFVQEMDQTDDICLICLKRAK